MGNIPVFNNRFRRGCLKTQIIQLIFGQINNSVALCDFSVYLRGKNLTTEVRRESTENTEGKFYFFIT